MMMRNLAIAFCLVYLGSPSTSNAASAQGDTSSDCGTGYIDQVIANMTDGQGKTFSQDNIAFHISPVGGHVGRDGSFYVGNKLIVVTLGKDVRIFDNLKTLVLTAYSSQYIVRINSPTNTCWGTAEQIGINSCIDIGTCY